MHTGMGMSFAVKVKQIREAARLKQAAFAEKLGVDQSTVSKWETGKQKPDTEALLALSEFSGENLFHDFHAEAEPARPRIAEPTPLPSGQPAIPADLVRMALELVLRRIGGISDSGAREIAALVLEELQAPESQAPGLDIPALRGALDYIIRRSGSKSDA
jgi:transcriptional regulator with XRE-family HTH domain